MYYTQMNSNRPILYIVIVVVALFILWLLTKHSNEYMCNIAKNFHCRPNRYAVNSEDEHIHKPNSRNYNRLYHLNRDRFGDCQFGRDFDWSVPYPPGANNTYGDLSWNYQSPRMTLIDNSMRCDEMSKYRDYKPPVGYKEYRKTEYEPVDYMRHRNFTPIDSVVQHGCINRPPCSALKHTSVYNFH